MIGNPHKAEVLSKIASDILEKEKDQESLLFTLVNTVIEQIKIGTLEKAESNLNHCIEVCKDLEDDFYEALVRHELGHLLSCRAAWKDADENFFCSAECV